MDRDTTTGDRLRGATTEESTSFLNGQDLPNDPEKVQDFKKRLEDFLVDEEEDMMGEMSQIVPDSRPYDKAKYDSILLNARSSRAVCQIFDSEPSGLCKSDAMESEFSLEDILGRMKEGHKVYKYNYNTPSRKIVTIKINNGIVEICTSETNKNRIGFADVYGITLGSCSSTFRMYKKQIDDKIGMLHMPEDCFSIINELRSYDFGTTSALARYDICLALSWLCSLNNSLQSNVPFTKCKKKSDFLSFKNISDKLKAEAKIRLISVHELFLVRAKQLAIYKTMKQKDSVKGQNKIVTILNKRFTFSGKLYRFIKFIVMPLILSDGYTRKGIRDKIRVNLLISNKLKALSSVLNRQEKEVDKLEAKTKRTVLESMIVPSCKSIFKQSDKVDPFLALLRQKAAK
jgi:hypothetical protein